MKSAASYFSLSFPLIKENLRRYWAVSAISFLVYFLSGVFPILMDGFWQQYFIESLLKNHHPPYMMAHLFVPVITGVVIFRYLQTAASVTSLHAMPFTRATLFNSHVLSGLILITLPIILTGLILLIVLKPLYYIYTVNWMWESFIIILVMYVVTVFAGLVTGNSLMHISAGFGFNFLIPGLFSVFILYGMQFLHGFTSSPELSSVILALSPYLQVFDNGGQFPPALQILYVLNALILFVLSMFLYYKRKLERASESFVFGFMITVISYIIAFFGMTGLGFYFAAVGYNDLYLYPGFLTGALIFFLIGRMVVKKTFRIFDRNTARSLCTYVLLAAVFVCSFAFDLTGFEKRVPDERNIRGVALSGHPLFMLTWTCSGSYALPVLHDEGNVAALREFHMSLRERDKKPYDFFGERYTHSIYFNIKYELAGMFDMYRAYSVNYGQIKDNKALARIYESEEYKSHLYLSDRAMLDELWSVTLFNPNLIARNNTVDISSRSQMEELLRLIDLDFAAQTYEEALSFAAPYAELYLNFNEHGRSSRYFGGYKIPRTFNNTINWLRDRGYAERLEITPDMISAISFNKYDNPHYTIEITDKEQIAVILDTFENSVYTREYYQGTIVLEGEHAQEFGFYDRYYSLYYSDETVPGFVLDLIKGR